MYVYLGIEYLAEDDFEKALEMYRHSIKICHYEENGFARILMAQTYLKAEVYGEACELALQLTRDGSRYSDIAYCVLAEVSYKQNKIGEAILFIKSAMKLKPQSALLLNLASLIEIEKPNETITLINKAIRLNSYLLNKKIYKTGTEPNIYKNQCTFLSSYRGLFSHV